MGAIYKNGVEYAGSGAVTSVDGKTGAVTVIPTGGTTGQVLAKASNTDRDVEWVNQSGGGGSSWTNDEEVLATGTWSSSTAAWAQTYTGVTWATLKQYRFIKVSIKCATGTNLYLRLGGAYLANNTTNATQEQFLLEFIDPDHRFYRWFKSQDALTIGTSSKIIYPATDTTAAKYASFQNTDTAFRIGEIPTTMSSTQELRIVNNTAQTGDGAWEVRGAIKA